MLLVYNYIFVFHTGQNYGGVNFGESIIPYSFGEANLPYLSYFGNLVRYWQMTFILPISEPKFSPTKICTTRYIHVVYRAVHFFIYI